jgi:hypothetical protein
MGAGEFVRLEASSGMQFSLRRLLASVTLIAIGMGALSFVFNYESERRIIDLAGIAAWFAGPASIGAGILHPFRMTRLGAFIALAFQVIVTAVLASTLRGLGGC